MAPHLSDRSTVAVETVLKTKAMDRPEKTNGGWKGSKGVAHFLVLARRAGVKMGRVAQSPGFPGSRPPLLRGSCLFSLEGRGRVPKLVPLGLQLSIGQGDVGLPADLVSPERLVLRVGRVEDCKKGQKHSR